jgi:hypothetical protein
MGPKTILVSSWHEYRGAPCKAGVGILTFERTNISLGINSFDTKGHIDSIGESIGDVLPRSTITTGGEDNTYAANLTLNRRYRNCRS